MEKPNLFKIAPEELAQDVFLTWLLQWADPKCKQSNEQMHKCGVAFVKMLLGKEDDVRFQMEKIEARREKKHIDVWAKVNDKYTIIIEDKTKAEEHSRQLERYREEAIKMCGQDGTELVCVYLKTTGMSLATRQRIEAKGYAIVDRKQLLSFFEQHPVEDEIYRDYVEQLQEVEALEKSWRTLPIEKWCKESWIGFYQYLETAIKVEGWGYVPNPSKGFEGLWWNFRNWQECNVYWQIEERKLCLKLGEVEDNHRELRSELLGIVLKHAKETGHTEIRRPGRTRSGRSMTVAMVEQQNWLGKDNTIVDVGTVVERLKKFGKFLDECVE